MKKKKPAQETSTLRDGGQITFGFRADGQKSIVRVQLEQRSHSVGVPPQEDLLVGGVQQDEGKDAVEQRCHLVDAEGVVEVKQNLAVHLGGVIEAKLLPQLSGPTRRRTSFKLLAFAGDRTFQLPTPWRYFSVERQPIPITI